MYVTPFEVLRVGVERSGLDCVGRLERIVIRSD
jgi:hypothetical protein